MALTTFTNGTVADADEVNANFQFVSSFGDGRDGAFSETAASTTNLTQGTVYQYSSFSLGVSHTISASTTSKYPMIIYVQGDCTINGTISLTGKGSPSSYTPLYGTVGANKSTGKKGFATWNYLINQKTFTMNGTVGGVGGGRGSSGGGGASVDNNGGGGGGVDTGSDGAIGAVGAGGCSLIIICGGDLTFGASSSIDVSGVDGGAGTTGDAGGSGGGGAGDILIFYNGSITDNGVTTDVTGGAGGAASGIGTAGGAGGAGNVKIGAYNTILW